MCLHLAKCLAHTKHLTMPVWLILVYYIHEYLNLLFRFSENVKVMKNRHKYLYVCVYIYTVMNPASPALSSLNYKLNSDANWLCSEGFMKCLNKSGRFLERIKQLKYRYLCSFILLWLRIFSLENESCNGITFFLRKNICSVREKRE